MSNTEKLLAEAIREHLLWMIDAGYTENVWKQYERILSDFFRFSSTAGIALPELFSLDSLEAFQQEKPTYPLAPMKNLARFLFAQGRIPKPQFKRQAPLPALYEDYLRYYSETWQVNPKRIQRARQLLVVLDTYLCQEKVTPASLRIEHLDRFLAGFNKGYSVASHNVHRSLLRGFLRYLYLERKILRRDLAPLLVGATQFARAKPPRFLRPQEIQQLFAKTPVSAKELRTYAMLHLAYTLGLRCKEISLISLDDISFRRGEITLPRRKAWNPVKLPLPENTLKAIAVYLAKARPQTAVRNLFVSLIAPYGPLTNIAVSGLINSWVQQAGVAGSAHCLRHTYAQNLLQQTNASIFEIKELMGHDRIQTTGRYLHIHLNLMREVLFDETI